MKSPQIDSEGVAAFAAEPDLHRPTLLAMMASLHEKIGKVLDAIDATGPWDDTLGFFLSDNAGLDQEALRPRQSLGSLRGTATSRADRCRTRPTHVGKLQMARGHSDAFRADA